MRFFGVPTRNFNPEYFKIEFSNENVQSCLTAHFCKPTHSIFKEQSPENYETQAKTRR